MAFLSRVRLNRKQTLREHYGSQSAENLYYRCRGTTPDNACGGATLHQSASRQRPVESQHAGFPCLSRTPKGTSYTSRRAFYPGAILDSAKQLVNQAQAFTGNLMGELNIGINSDFAFLRLDQLLKDSQ